MTCEYAASCPTLVLVQGMCVAADAVGAAVAYRTRGSRLPLFVGLAVALVALGLLIRYSERIR